MLINKTIVGLIAMNNIFCLDGKDPQTILANNCMEPHIFVGVNLSSIT